MKLWVAWLLFALYIILCGSHAEKMEASMAKIPKVGIKPTKNNSYALHYTNPDGRRRRLSVGKNYQDAERLKSKFDAWLLEGKDPELEMEKAKQKEKVRSITLREFYPVFMERHGKHQSRSMQEIYKYRFKNIVRCPELANIPICNIKKHIMLDYMNARMEQDGVSYATVNREAAMIKSMLFRAVEWDILERNPLQGFKLLKEADKRKVNITLEETGKLIAELIEPLANIVEFAIYTGFRKENILSLRIESIKFHDLTPTGEVKLVVKGGKAEIFPLNQIAIEILKKAIGNRKTGYVFLNSKTNTRYFWINKAFDNAVRKVGLTVNGSKFRFHDLRHVYATWLLRSGIGLDTIRELLGHKDRETTDRYAWIDRMEAGRNINSIPRIPKIVQMKGDNGIIDSEVA